MYASGSRFITGSGGNTDAFLNVQDNYTIIVDTISKGLSAIPDLVVNTTDGIKVTQELQYLSSSASTPEVAEAVKSDFRLISSLIERGVSNKKPLLAKSTTGYGPDNVYNISGNTQITSSIYGSSYDIDLIDTNFDIIMNIVENGNAATSSYIGQSNVSSSIQTTNTTQYKSSAILDDNISLINSNFDTILTIVEKGSNFAPIVMSNTSSSIKVTNESQYISDISSSFEVVNKVSESLSIVYNILDNGTGSLPTLAVSNSFENPSIDYQNAYTLLIENIPFIQEETIAFLSSSWSEFEYNQTTCKRDVSFIVSGAAHDLLYGGNEESLRSGLFYYQFPSDATTTQKDPTLTAVKYASGIVSNILSNISFVETTADVDNGYDLIFENKEFIRNETIAYISSSWSGFDYNEVKCKRDIGYILDAVATDLKYGGNERSVVAGNFYYKYPSLATVDDRTTGQLQQTLDAIKYAKRITEKLVKNETFAEPNSETKAAYDLILANRELIQNETITYIGTQYPNFTYDQVKCRRDVGYMLDNVATDLLYGGNERSELAGLYYFLYPSIANTTQLEETLEAIRYVKGMAKAIAESIVLDTPRVVTNVEGKIKVTSFNSVTSSLSATSTEISKVSSSFGIVEDIIKFGSDSILGAIAENSDTLTWSESKPLSVSTLSQTTSSASESELVQIINTNFGVVTDIISGGTDATPSIVSSWSGSVKLTDTNQYISSSYSGNEYASNFISSSISIVANVVQNGTGSFPTLIENTSASFKLSETSQIRGTAGTSTQTDLVSSSFAIVSDVIENGLSVVPEIVSNNAGNIKSTNTTIVSSSLSASLYEVNLVSESFGRIIDIITNGVSSIPTIILNTSASIKVNDVQQYTSSISAGASDISFVSQSIEIVTDIIKFGSGSYQTAGTYTTPSTNESTIAAYQILRNNLEFIKDETISYLSSSWSTASYDESKCRRDVGLIVSGAAEDLIWNTNSASIVNGKFYLEYPSAAEGSQLNQTLDGIEYASRLAQSLIQNIEFTTASNEAIVTNQLLIDNTEFIQNEVISFMSSSWSTFDYNETVCRRDVAHIVHAVATDVLYGGNERSVTAGNYYFRFPSAATGSQLQQTTDAIKYASGLSNVLIQNQSFTEVTTNVSASYSLLLSNKEFIQNEVITYLSSSWSTFDYNEVTCKRDVGFIIDAAATDLYYGGNERSVIAGKYYYLYPSQATTSQLGQTLDGVNYARRIAEKVILNTEFVSPSTELLDVKDILFNNKEFIQNEVIAFVSSSWSQFEYNQTTCKRDVGYILDAAITDLVYGGNERSIIAADYYFKYPSAAIVGGIPSVSQQKDPTVDAIKYLGGISEQITLGEEFTLADVSKVALRDEIITNKAYIQQNVIDFINDTYPKLTYLRDKCYRDVGFILDAVVTDMVYGGNARSVQAGSFYFRFPSQATYSQLSETVDGINFARDLAKLIAKGAKTVEDSFDTIITIIESGSSIVTTQELFTDDGFPIATVGTPKSSYGDKLVTTVESTTLPNGIELVENSLAGIKFGEGTQTTSSLSASLDTISKVSSSFSDVIDIIKYGTSGSLELSGSSTATTYFEIVTLGTGDNYYYVNVNQIQKFDDSDGKLLGENSGSYDDGIKDPTITLKRGELYSFSVNPLTYGFNPLYIKTRRTAGATDLYEKGVTNNGVNFGTLLFIVPLDAPDRLFYVNGSNPNAGGVINIVDNLPLSGDQRYVIVPSQGSIEVTTNNADNIKVTDNIQFFGNNSSSIDDRLIVSGGYSDVIDVIKNGVGNLPTLITNTENRIARSGLTQYTSSLSASLSLANSIKDSFNIVTNIIENGVEVIPSIDENTNDTIKVTSTSQYVGSLVSASQNQINNVSSSFGIIIDVLQNGIGSLPTLVSNNEFGVVVNGLDSRYTLETSAGDYEFGIVTESFDTIIDIITNGVDSAPTIVSNLSASIKVSNETQYISSSASGSLENVNFVSQSVKIVTDIIQNGSGSYQTASLYVTPSTDESTIAAYQIIRNNLDFIKEETISYLSSSWTTASYDEDKCRRDVGLIISGAAEDLIWNTNSASIVNGKFYLEYPSQAETSQLNQTLDGIEYASRLTQKLIQNIEFVYPTLEASASFDLIINNKELIKNETITYMSSSWSTFDYSETLCRRDLEHILNAVATDLKYGGNERSVIAGNYYFRFPSAATGSQLQQTTDAVRYAKGLVQKLITNDTLYSQPLRASGSYDLLVNNKTFIQEETIAYLSSSWSTFDYNEVTCKRDIGYIIDAVATDLLYGGNERSRIAAEFYYLYPSDATGSQLNQTIDGVNYARRIAEKVIQNTELVEASTERTAAYDLLFNNKEFIQNETITFLSASWSEFEYNQETCKRDVGYIIDAVATDTLYGGNERSSKAGEFYYLYPSTATTSQLSPTLTGVDYAKGLVFELVQNNQFSSASVEKENTYTLLVENKQLIKDEVISYISSSWSEFDYNEAKCRRDTGYIVDAVATDVLYGGNERTYTAGEFYYLFPSSATVSGSESPTETAQLYPTLDGLIYAQRLSDRLLSHTTLVTASLDRQATHNLIFENRDLIQTEVISFMSSSWSDFEYIESKCKRDVGFILDAVATDVLYGGNERSVNAGEFYYLFPSQATSAQLDQTLTGVKHAAGLTNKVIQNLILVNADEDIKSSYTSLVNNREFIQSEVIEFIDSLYPYFTYDRVKCRRDVGYIIDAVATDLLWGGNERSIIAGDYYYRFPSQATTDQLSQTTLALRYAKAIAKQVILNNIIESPELIQSWENNIKVTDTTQYSGSISVGTTELSKVSSSFAIVTDIIENGLSSLPTEVKSTSDLIKVTNSNQITSLLSGSETQIGIISASIDMINDIIRLGSDNIPFTIAKNFQTSELDTPQNLTTGSVSIPSTEVAYTAARVVLDGLLIADDYGSELQPPSDFTYYDIIVSKRAVNPLIPQELEDRALDVLNAYNEWQSDITADVTTELGIISSSFNQINDIIENGTGSLPTLVTNVENNIKVTDIQQYTSLVSGSSVEVTIVNERAGLIENIVQNGTSVIPTIVQNNTDISTLIKVGNVEQYVSASGADKLQSKIVSSSFGIVIDIISNGSSSIDTLVDYTDVSESPKTILAYNLLKQNIEFIKEETILFMSSSWSNFEYDDVKCRRDVGLIVSGAAEDLLWNANSASIVNGKFYLEYPSAATGSQLDQTVTAIRYASNLAQNIVRNYEYVTPSSEVSASYDLLVANKEFIQNETIEFVSSSWSNFSYNETTCKRDVGYIVDAVATDLLYGGNERSITAGRYYYDYPSAAIVGGVPSATQQKDPTVTAINYVKGLLTELVDGAIFQTASNEVEYTYDSLRLNREFIQNEVIAFVNAKYPNLEYDSARCKRDTGFIVDAVATDLRWGGNQRSSEAGRFYYLFPSQATNVQLGETTDAVTYASDLVKEIVLKNTLSIPTLTENTANNIKVTSTTQTLGVGTTDEYTLNAVSSSFGIVMDIVLNGTGSLPTISEYTQSLNDTEVSEAYSLLKSNIPFIQSEVIAYISSSWSGFEYNEASCSRDVGLIVSGAAEDLLFGSVSSSVTNGEFYYLYPSDATGSQLNQTLDGIRYASRLANSIIQSVTYVTSSIENVTSYNLLRDNKEFIQSESIAYISSSWSTFGYNEETCKRDVGYIIDAISTDILYGGNERSVTAGDFYYRYPSNATTSELEPTTTGIEYAGDLAEKIIVNEVFVTASAERLAGNETLLQNRSFIQNEVIAYISSSWSNFEYNEASCSRDTGYIVDAVATDLLYGGNERSRTAGEFYYLFPSSATVKGSVSPNVNAQLYPTLDGVKYASGIAQKLVQNVEFVTASAEVLSTWNSLRDNKEFIQKETIAYVSSSWSGVYYNEASCSRDVGFIIDAAATDLLYGGNIRSVVAGDYYFRFPSAATERGVPSTISQLDPTVTGIRYASGMAQNVIQNVEFFEPSASVILGAQLLQNNKTFIQKETIAFLSSSWSEFDYNEASCSRDIGYILDAVTTDLIYGGNERSVQAATFYYYIPSVATTEQKPQTIDGIDFAKGISEKVILNEQLLFASLNRRNGYADLRAAKKYLQSSAITYTAGAFPNLVYNEEKCYRDTGFILDAISTDLLYGGNERSIEAASSYYTGVYGDASVAVNEQKKETAETNRYLRTLFQKVARNAPLEFFGSLIITTGHDFSYAGAGVTYKALPPNQGGNGVPKPEREITELAGGRVFFTSGNELGDFRIGTGLVINQATGTLQGRTFSRSLFSLVTPFSLALEG